MSEYVPIPDPEGVNSSPDKASIKDAILLVVGFLAVVVGLTWVVALAVDRLAPKLSIQSEMRYLSWIWSAKDQNTKNPKLEEILAPIRARLPVKVHFDVMCSEDANAFALPGGRVYLTSGLIQSVSSENGLLFVVGHEVGHILNRDHLRGVARQLVITSLYSLLGLGNSSATHLMGGLVNRSFGREQELAADQLALDWLKSIFGHSLGADEFFRSVERKSKDQTQVFQKFLSTHPATEDRLARMKTTVSSADAKLKPLDKVGLLQEAGCSEP